MTDWRVLDAERVASGAVIYRASWICHHAKGRQVAVGYLDRGATTPQVGGCVDCGTPVTWGAKRCRHCSRIEVRGRDGYRRVA